MSQQLRFLSIGSATQDVYLSGGQEFLPIEQPVLVRQPNRGMPARVVDTTEIAMEDFSFKLGDKLNVGKIDFRTGGGASNAATTFARAGAESFFAGKVGRNDPAALAVLHDLDQEGIDTSLVNFSETYNTDYSTVLLANGSDNGGERTILTYRGCGYHLRADDWDFAKIFSEHEFDWIYITGLAGHFPIYDKLFREAEKHGVKIAWNPSNFELSHPDKLRALLPDVTIFSVNKEEAQKIVDGNKPEDLVRSLRNSVPIVIVTDGRNGAVAGDKTSIVKAGLYAPDAKRVDATGAGDAFASMFTIKYAGGSGLRDAVHWASANSASVVNKIGSKPGILTGREKLAPMQIDVRPINY